MGKVEWVKPSGPFNQFLSRQICKNWENLVKTA